MIDHIHGIPEERPDLCPSCKCCAEWAAHKKKKRALERGRRKRVRAKLAENWTRANPSGLEPPTG